MSDMDSDNQLCRIMELEKEKEDLLEVIKEASRLLDEGVFTFQSKEELSAAELLESALWRYKR
jgi:hypothetical protein